VVAVAINHEGLRTNDVPVVCTTIARETRIPVCDPLLEGAGPIVDAILEAQSTAPETAS
jgi:uncharacterized NAD-dependent epimerase/dehydratase family protein